LIRHEASITYTSDWWKYEVGCPAKRGDLVSSSPNDHLFFDSLLIRLPHFTPLLSSKMG
jgi:hypothetical protein